MPVESKLPGPECSIRSHNQLRLAQLPREKVHWTVRRYFQKTVCKPQVFIKVSHKRYKNSTALSTELWKVKEMNGTPSINWKIVRTAKRTLLNRNDVYFVFAKNLKSQIILKTA